MDMWSRNRNRGWPVVPDIKPSNISGCMLTVSGLMLLVKRACVCRAKLGVDAFADALLSIPKILAENAGFDPQECLIKMQEEFENGVVVGLDLDSGEPIDPDAAGIWDNYLVKKQLIQSAPVIATQLLLVDEVLRAGINMRKRGPG